MLQHPSSHTDAFGADTAGPSDCTAWLFSESMSISTLMPNGLEMSGPLSSSIIHQALHKIG
jgi:hypothetical protein